MVGPRLSKYNCRYSAVPKSDTTLLEGQLLQPVPTQSMDTVKFIKGECYGQSVIQPAGTRKAVNMGRSRPHIKIT
jgi:hypothetical protein